MILKEYVCLAHGDFDAESLAYGSPPPCPHGCGVSMVQRVFRTAPMIQSRGYRTVNASLEKLAREHGLTNMRNAPGESMRKHTWEGERRLQHATDLVMNSSRSGMQGADAGQFFQPLTSMPRVAPGSSPTLRKAETASVTDNHGRVHTYGVGKTIISGGDGGPTFELGMPKVQLHAQPFDGSKLGVPAGDAS